MADVTLQAEPRQSGRHAVRELRQGDRVPAVVYGRGVDPQVVSVYSRDLRKALVTAGTSLISLRVGSAEPVYVLAREVQQHPFKHYAQHVDFLAVAMNETIRLHVPILLEGTAPALARSGVVLIHNFETVEIECLPAVIPQHLSADMGKLQTADDSLYVHDLVVPEGIKILAEPDQVIVSLTMSRTEAEAEAAAAETPTTEVEVVTKGKAKEGEEGEQK